MYQHLTKLLLTGVVAVALLALGSTSILSPAWAAKPGKLPASCASGEIAKWDGSVWVCDNLAGVDAGPKTVFVTSGRFRGDLRALGGALTGLRGGDEFCQAAAEQGIVPPGSYIAWLSVSGKGAIDRLPANSSGYILPDGVKVADDKADLVSCGLQCLDHPIDVTETGSVIPQTLY